MGFINSAQNFTKNGLEIKRMTAAEFFPGSRWFDVVDPALVHRRVEIAHGKHRVTLLLLAKTSPRSRNIQNSTAAE